MTVGVSSAPLMSTARCCVVTAAKNTATFKKCDAKEISLLLTFFIARTEALLWGNAAKCAFCGRRGEHVFSLIGVFNGGFMCVGVCVWALCATCWMHWCTREAEKANGGFFTVKHSSLTEAAASFLA